MKYEDFVLDALSEEIKTLQAANVYMCRIMAQVLAAQGGQITVTISRGGEPMITTRENIETGEVTVRLVKEDK